MTYRSLGQTVLTAARAHPERPALWARGEMLTYAELLARAAPLAGTIRSRGLAWPGDRVAVLAERSATLYVGILAALLAGCAYVPLNARFPRARNRSILARSGARLLIADERHRAMTPELLRGTDAALLLPESDEPTPMVTRLPCEDGAGDLAYVFFTSGSTGEPKGVPIRHRSVLAYLDGIGSIFRPTPEDRVLQLVDTTFDLSVHDIFLAWTNGACLYSVPENAALLATRFVEEHCVTTSLAVPSTAGQIRQAGLLEPGGMPSLRHSFFCGEALTGAVASAWARAAPNSAIHNIYGPTEATIAISAFRCDPATVHDMAVVPLGEPLGEQRMRLFDADGEQSEKGEICLAGTQVTDGYWQAPELTAQRFFEAEGVRWYRTGDLGGYDPAVGFTYMGRADQQVKIRGFRVELQEIETAVRRVAKCDLAAVVPWPLSADGGALGCVAFVQGEADEGWVLVGLADVLPDYMVPTRIIAIPFLPFNSNGKVDYPTLRAHSALSG